MVGWCSFEGYGKLPKISYFGQFVSPTNQIFPKMGAIHRIAQNLYNWGYSRIFIMIFVFVCDIWALIGQKGAKHIHCWKKNWQCVCLCVCLNVSFYYLAWVAKGILPQNWHILLSAGIPFQETDYVVQAYYLRKFSMKISRLRIFD